MTPTELEDVVRFIADQQARVDRRIAYVGTEAPGIRAELDGMEPPWASTVRAQRGPDGALTGVVVVEWDEQMGRAWIIGPWVAADDDADEAWAAAAGELLDAALAQLPDGVTNYELSGDITHQGLAALAAARGWGPSEPSHLLTVDAAVVATWPDGDDGRLRPPTAADVATIAPLHDAEFPGTYATVAQVVAGGLDGSRVVLVADADADADADAEAKGEGEGDGIAGYAAGEVHEDGEGYIDFVAVDPAARGRGVGRRLVVALTRRLLDRSPLGQVSLTVQEHRVPARALYARLGFRPEGVLVGYRSWLPGAPDAPGSHPQ